MKKSGLVLGKHLLAIKSVCCLLMALLFFSELARADRVPPTAPGSLQGVRYSSTAGEIFWSSATDDSLIVGYRVIRDGLDLGIRDAKSVFEPTLQPQKAYRYRVSAVDRFGNEGAALTVEISAINGQQNVAQADDISAPDIPASPQVLPDSTAMTLSSRAGRVTLTEGDTEGVSIALSLQREGSSNRSVQLSLEADNARDLYNLRYVFSPSTLGEGESGSVVTLHLDVGVAPLLLHERHFRLVADDGVSRTSRALTIDVSPTSAPDVYLLIGQSNMEGYSELGSRESFAGGLDERHPRIHQLNVQPNSRSVFYSDGMFSDEQSNISSPSFVPAEDPLHEPRFMGIDGKEATFVGLGLTFAKSALTSTTSEIYLVPAAWGATGFCANANGDLAWNAWPTPAQAHLGGTLLADRALTRLNMTLRETGGVLRGILWHQGGADANNPDCARDYANNLSQLVSRLRSEARQDGRGAAARGAAAIIPFVVATQSRGDDERGQFSVFNPSKVIVDAAHRSVNQFIAHSDFVNNDDLVPSQYPCGQTSCVHFGATALREQGRRFFAAFKRLWSNAGTYHY